MNCNSRSLTEIKLAGINSEIVACELCPRLRQHRLDVAQTKRRAYFDWEYWGKPVPSFGDPNARLLILGLAPGAHGANRTGRMFTGDSSGDFLYRAMHKAGFASQPTSRNRDDGLQLHDAWISASAHCAPPDNKPTSEELRNCRPFLHRELDALTDVKVVLVLGRVAFDTYLATLRERKDVKKHCAFFHCHVIEASPLLLCSYHPSQQNTSTGKLTEEMFDLVFAKARSLVGEADYSRTSSVCTSPVGAAPVELTNMSSSNRTPKSSK